MAERRDGGSQEPANRTTNEAATPTGNVVGPQQGEPPAHASDGASTAAPLVPSVDAPSRARSGGMPGPAGDQPDGDHERMGVTSDDDEGDPSSGSGSSEEDVSDGLAPTTDDSSDSDDEDQTADGERLGTPC